MACSTPLGTSLFDDQRKRREQRSAALLSSVHSVA